MSNSVLESFPYNFPVGTAENERGQSLNRYEVARPLFCNLKGGYHISCPFGYVGRGRVRVVTHGLNLPRHGTEAACRICGFYSVRDAGQNRRRSVKGSRRNNFTFSGVEAPAWQGARRANSKLFNRRATQPGGMDRRIKM